MRRTLLAAFLFGMLCASGCVFPYCAYPTLDYTPAVKINAPAEQVRAFRVDISKPTADVGVFVSPVYERLSELPVTNAGEIAAQFKPSFTYGFAVLGIALNYLTHTSHSMLLRLYRPGFELIEIKSWVQVKTVVWKPIPHLDDQEVALDALFPIARFQGGTNTVGHREALLFGATEYDRLAASTESKDQRVRLAEKAAKLREWAGE